MRGFFRTPLDAGLERERQGLLERKQVQRRRPARQQHEVRHERRLVRRLGDARRRVDEDDVGFFRGRARTRPQGCGGVRDFLDAPREHAVALLRPRRQAVLRIGVQHRNALAHSGELGRQVAGDGGLTHPALPSRNGDDGHKQYYTITRSQW